MPNVLITGSNRGLGLEWVRQYADAGWRVFATCRRPHDSVELQAIAAEKNNISIHRLDVTKADEINAVAVELLNEPVDVLLNNAGTYLEKFSDVGLKGIRYQDWAYTFRVNTMGAVKMTEAFLDNIARSQRRLVVVISTHMASIADIEAPGSYYYRSSKAALNAVMKGISLELRAMKIGLLILHPGWVKTRMGGQGAPLNPTESVRGMMELVEGFRFENSGRFFRYDGIELPW